MAAARRIPHARHVGLRLAIGNIHRPGALTPSVVMSLGLGLALLVSLTLIDGNIRNQLREALPGQTPSFFFVDIQSAQAKAFDDFLRAQAPDARLESVPMMRGRITRVKDERAETVTAKENAAWVLEGDRGITFAEKIPDGSRLATGEWWPADYKGPPLVSMEAEIADGLGLKIGDPISVNVLGRAITARDRQSAHGQLAVVRHQFRAGVLAQHLRRRAAYLAGDRHFPEGDGAGARVAPAGGGGARLSGRSPACG
jgi:putative ABC transport system permease protein